MAPVMQNSESLPHAWAERAVVYRRPSDLRRYDKNARRHPPEQVEQIAASFLEFGINAPILLKDDEITIGVGNGRHEAAELILARGQRLPTPDGETVPTITLRGLTEAQWRAYVLADNKLALSSDWDMDLLGAELDAIMAENEALVGLAGFSDADLEAILGEVEANFQPLNPEEVKPLDRLALRKCPSCGHEFRA